MRKSLICALLALVPALPAAAQILSIEGILVEPRHPTASDRIRLTAVGAGTCIRFLEPVYDNATGAVLLPVEFEDCPPASLPRPFRQTFEVGPLPAGRHFAELRIEHLPGLTWRELIEVREDAAQLALGQDDPFAVNVHWSNPRDGGAGVGHARRLARDSGAFWFFSPDNLELTVKILDGRAVNGRWWVFIASMTDLQVEVEIAQQNGAVKTYVQNAGANRNFIDVNAFEEAPPPVSEPAATTPEIVVEPEHPTAADPVRVEVAVQSTEPDIAYYGMQGHHLIFNYNTYAYPSGGPYPEDRRYVAEATVGPLAAGVYAVDLRKDGRHELGRTFEVAAASPALVLQDAGGGRSEIRVSYRLPGASQLATAPAVPLTRDSGYFYFFDRDNAEVTAKVLDGRPVNGHWWVFLASMTTLELEIEVTHCPPQAPPAYCITKTYVQPPGQNRNFLDTSTF